MDSNAVNLFSVISRGAPAGTCVVGGEETVDGGWDSYYIRASMTENGGDGFVGGDPEQTEGSQPIIGWAGIMYDVSRKRIEDEKSPYTAKMGELKSAIQKYNDKFTGGDVDELAILPVNAGDIAGDALLGDYHGIGAARVEILNPLLRHFGYPALPGGSVTVPKGMPKYFVGAADKSGLDQLKVSMLPYMADLEKKRMRVIDAIDTVMENINAATTG